jgi:hypothetical protein
MRVSHVIALGLVMPFVYAIPAIMKNPTMAIKNKLTTRNKYAT